VRHRPSRAGDRKLNHAIYLMAIVQVRPPPPGRAYYRRKRAEGKAPREALRCLKRRLSDAVYRCLLADQHHPTRPVLEGGTPKPLPIDHVGRPDVQQPRNQEISGR
jgi:transposase